MFFLNRSKTILALILTAIGLYGGLMNLSQRMNWLHPVDGLSWVPSDGQVVAAGPESRSGSSIAIEAGDVLIDISGISIRSLDDYTEVVEVLAKDGAAVTIADYTVRKAGTKNEVTYPIEIRRVSKFSRGDIPLLLVALIFLVIGIFIYLRNWQASGAFHFFLICLVAFILLGYRYSGRADLLDVVVYWSSAAALLLFSALFLHFCCYFPQPLAWVQEKPQMKILLYLPSLLLLLLHVLWFNGSLKPIGLPRTLTIAQFFDRVHLGHFLFFMAMACVALMTARKQTRCEVHARQMQWLVRGVLMGLGPFFLAYGIPYLLDMEIRDWMKVSVLSLALIPLTFGYAITRHRLMDVDLIFKRGVAYVLSSSALLAGYAGIVLLIARAFQDLSPESGFLLVALFALVIAFLFAPLRDKVQEQIDRKFYKDQYSYRQSFSDFSKTLGSEISLDRLAEKISSRIQKTLHVSRVAIFLRDEHDSELFHLYSSQNFGEGEQSGHAVRIPQVVFQRFSPQLFPLALPSGSRAVEVAREEFADLSLNYIQPLRARGQIIGFLGLGSRKNGEFLTTEDLELVSLLADYGAIAIENARLYRSLERKAGELSRMTVFNENVIESITLGVAVISLEGTVSVWNSAMAELSGVPRSEALQKDICRLLPKDVTSSLLEVAEGPGWQLEIPGQIFKTHLAARNGESTRLVNITLSPFVSFDDVNTGTLLVFDDITEKIRLETQLLQAEKLSSIGLFAAGLAHEVNTPLAGISSYTQMLLEETPPEDERHAILKKIETQSFRASEIINNLLNFARFSGSELEKVNVNSLMTDTLSLLQHQLRKNKIEVQLELEPTLPQTVGSGGKLQQVFANFFLNAKDAMPRGGQLRIQTFSQNSELVIRIQDSGIGISKEDIKKIYDPFFTTKQVGKGTGLGLSVSYGIIQEHSGRISVDSAPGKGTTFTLHLPVRRVN